MTRRGIDDSVTRMQAVVAAALCAIGLALALVPPPAPQGGPKTEAAGPERPAPERPEAGGAATLVAGTLPAGRATLSRC